MTQQFFTAHTNMLVTGQSVCFRDLKQACQNLADEASFLLFDSLIVPPTELYIKPLSITTI